MSGKPTNKMEVTYGEHGNLIVDFVDLTLEEYEAIPTPPEPVNAGFSLNSSNEAINDPTLRVMEAECALHGFSKATGHIWGE
jgi:hypothetical protein